MARFRVTGRWLFPIVFFFALNWAFAQDRGQAVVMECASLTSGFDLGYDDSASKRGWLDLIPDKDCAYFRLSYPPNLQWGTLYIVASPLLPLGSARRWMDYSSFDVDHAGYITVEMKGDRGNENVLVGIKTVTDPDNGSEVTLPVSLTQSWQMIQFPLSSFVSRRPGETVQDRLQKLYVVMELVFNGAQARTVYLRRVRFGPTQPILSALSNSAGAAPNVAPGELVSLYGTDIGPASPATCRLDTNGRVVTSCGEVQVLFDGVAAPIIYAASGQINAQVPYDVAKRTATSVRVVTAGRTSNELTLPVRPSVPGIFSDPSRGQALASNEDGTLNGVNNPAQKGHVAVFYATGHGEEVPPAVTGQPCPGLSRTAQTCSATIGGKSVTPIYCGCAPGFIGLLQVNLPVPADVNAGFLPLFLTIGNSTSQPGVSIWVK